MKQASGEHNTHLDKYTRSHANANNPSRNTHPDPSRPLDNQATKKKQTENPNGDRGPANDGSPNAPHAPTKEDEKEPSERCKRQTREKLHNLKEPTRCTNPD